MIQKAPIRVGSFGLKSKNKCRILPSIPGYFSLRCRRLKRRENNDVKGDGAEFEWVHQIFKNSKTFGPRMVTIYFSIYHKNLTSFSYNWLSMWDANSPTGVQFPACARSRMLTLGKLANLNHIPNAPRLATRYIEEVSI